MSEALSQSAARPAWLDHFARVSAGHFVPSALAGPEPGEAIEAELLETGPPGGVEDPAIDADLLAQAFEEGRRTAELEHQEQKAALAALAEGLEALRPEPPAALAAVLAETVERLVRDIAGSAAVDPDILAARAQGAAALLSDEIAPSTLFVHPDDLPLLASATLPLPLACDPALARGSVKLEYGAGWIEDGPEIRLERLRLALDRMGGRE